MANPAAKNRFFHFRHAVVWDKFYFAMCDDIKRERRVSEGKNFVVSQAVYTR